MPPLTQDIRTSREAVERLLDGFGLSGFTYTVEPREEGWVVRVGCTTQEGWQDATLPVRPHELTASMTDPAVRERLRREWEPHLRACTRHATAGVPRWEHYEHEADIGVRGVAATKSAAFEQAALALTAVITDLDTVKLHERVVIECEAPEDELLFAEWLNALVYEMSTRRMLFGRFAVRLEGTRLAGEAWGETVDPARHHPAVEVKGATYTTLRVACERDGWVAQTVVDV
jgi:tRNA nucleotidyltransferase (CCA-adding enzyme)